MRARPQPRKPSTQEVEAHMNDHHPFRSWCRYCVMAASRSDHHRRQAEDYNEVPVMSCDCVFFTDSRDDEERQLTEAEARAVGTTPILVILDKRSKMIHTQTVCAPKDLETNCHLKLNCCVEPKNSEKQVSKQCTTQAQHTTAGHAEIGVRIVKEKVHTLICFARELHGVTIGKSHFPLPWCVRFA